MSATPWQAALSLAFTQRDPRTVLSHRQHIGPLLVQRPFYPETDGTAHLYILHPPAGIVGGDVLRIEVQLHAHARALLTTPAATKLYAHPTTYAQQVLQAEVADHAVFEWLPQETIAFNGSRCRNQVHIQLQDQGLFIGWDTVCLGRPAIAERFSMGELCQRFQLFHNGQPIWLERVCYQGNAPALHEMWGLQGQPVFSTFICAMVEQGLVTAVREALASASVTGDSVAVTWLDGVLVVRYLGTKVSRAHQLWQQAWAVVRQQCLGKDACAPRIWAT